MGPPQNSPSGTGPLRDRTGPPRDQEIPPQDSPSGSVRSSATLAAEMTPEAKGRPAGNTDVSRNSDISRKFDVSGTADVSGAAELSPGKLRVRVDDESLEAGGAGTAFPESSVSSSGFPEMSAFPARSLEGSDASSSLSYSPIQAAGSKGRGGGVLLSASPEVLVDESPVL
ncbi:hypothetical protein T484DRAFT_1831282 [Baffinella frigidus]|nr:hypothetical protein T484DRAFT_1831282 [Cryptophyta sp. CCMP2293]